MWQGHDPGAGDSPKVFSDDVLAGSGVSKELTRAQLVSSELKAPSVRGVGPWPILSASC